MLKNVINDKSCTYLTPPLCEKNVVFHKPIENITVCVSQCRKQPKINCKNITCAYTYYIVKLREKYKFQLVSEESTE